MNCIVRLGLVRCMLFALAGGVSGAELPPLPSGRAVLPPEPSAKAPATTNSMPQFVGKSIRCGNKELLIHPEQGSFVLSQDGEELANSYSSISVKDLKTGKSDWTFPGDGRYFDNKRMQSVFTDNKYVNDTWFAYGDLTWHYRHLEIEILPGGLIQVRQEIFAPPQAGVLELGGINYFLSVKLEMARSRNFAVDGRTLGFDEKPATLQSKREGKEIAVVLYQGDPARKITLRARRGEGLSAMVLQMNSRGIVALLTGIRPQAENPDHLLQVFDIDLRHGIERKQTQDTRGGVNFQRIEGLEMPDVGSGNYVRNPSFEEGLKDYFMRFEGTQVPDELLETKWRTNFFSLDPQQAKFGRHALRMIASENPNPRDIRALRYTPNLSLSPMVVPAGVYTFSFSIKGDQPDLNFQFWCTGLRSSTLFTAIVQKEEEYCAQASTPVTAEWQRHRFTMRVPMDDAVFINFNATRKSGIGTVWLDGLQFQAGEQATAFTGNPVEGELRTSDPDNVIAAGEKINAALRLTASPMTAGKVQIRVKDFFGQELLRKALPFQADALGDALVKLPLDTPAIGQGLFMLRADYELADGRSCFSQYRFAVVDFAGNAFKHARIFANVYGGEAERYDIDRRLARYRQVGIGGGSHIVASSLFRNPEKSRLKYQEYGIDAGAGILACPINKTSWKDVAGFGVVVGQVKPEDRGFPWLLPDNPIIVMKDHKLSACQPDDAYFARFKEAAKKRAQAYSGVKLWEFYNEFFAAFPVEWWNDEHDPDQAYALYARYLKAYYEGVKEANPDAVLMPDATFNMNETGGLAEKRRLLPLCNKLGFKFDAMAFHVYRPAPEDPDLDTGIQNMLTILKNCEYPPKTQFFFAEGMHWGPYEIPAWTLQSARWAHTPTTWPSQSCLSYDLGQTERRSAAWRARSWLVALKYGDQVLQLNSGNTNNFELDLMMTPRASQLVSNTLGKLLGNADFRKDIRFAPFVRAYVFADERQRPVAVVWCHKREVDFGTEDAPVAEADFGDSLESVRDLMNQPHAFEPGVLRFPVMSTPLFLCGKPGSLPALVAAMANAQIVAGTGIAPVHTAATPLAPEQVALRFRNFVSKEFHGVIDDKSLTVPGDGEGTVTLPLPTALRFDRETDELLQYRMQSGRDLHFDLDLSFRGLLVQKVDPQSTLATLDWSKLPRIELANRFQTPGPGFKAAYRLGWNESGFFVEVTVQDPHFSHYEFAVVGNRWDNDCLQLYFDALADARGNQAKGYDHNDYDYAVYPDQAGIRSLVYRSHSADQQESLGIYAPANNTVADDIPSSFVRIEGGYVYHVFFPAKYLLPAAMRKGQAMGLGICVNDANDDLLVRWLTRRVGALTNSLLPGGDCYNKPHVYPAVLLWE